MPTIKLTRERHKMSSEQVWQFHVVDGHQFEKNGAVYFADRVGEMAETFGCRLINTKNIDLQNTLGGKWIVTGTAVLEKPKANPSPFRLGVEVAS